MSNKDNKNDEFEEVLQDIYKLSNKHEKFKIDFSIMNPSMKRLDSRKTRSAFQAGIVAALACTSLYHDYLGQEGLIKLIESSWIDSSITVPISLIALFIVYATRKSWS